MSRLGLRFVFVGSITIAQAMESPQVVLRSEINDGSPVNSRSSGFGTSSKSPNNSQNITQNNGPASPPLLLLDGSMSSRDPQKETLLDIAERGVVSYKSGRNEGHKYYSTAYCYFTTVLDQKPEIQAKNPKSVAIAKLYLATMAFRGEITLDKDQQRGLAIADKYLKEAAQQIVDPKIATAAMMTLARLTYGRGLAYNNNDLLKSAIRDLQEVVSKQEDEESAITARLVLSEAAQLGKGMKRDINTALQYAQKAASQKKYPYESLKGSLQCAWLYMEGIESPDWNFKNYGHAELYLTRPRMQSQFGDMRSKAEALYAKLQAKVQECQYQEGLAYIRRALPVKGYDGARIFWDGLGEKKINTLQELKARSAEDYACALSEAEHYFEQAAYADYNPHIKIKARDMLGWIYQETGRPNKFEEFEKIAGRLTQAANAKN